MRVIKFSLLIVILLAYGSTIYASNFSTDMNSHCYGESSIDDCKKHLGTIDVRGLTNGDDLFRFARAYEHAYRDDGKPELAFSITIGLAQKYPDNIEYYPYLIFLYKNYSKHIGDDDWWTALSYALQTVRVQPNNQFGYFWTSVLLEELHLSGAMLDSMLVFSVKNFESAARSDDPLINKLYTAGFVRQKFIQHNDIMGAELFSDQALDQLNILAWADELFQDLPQYENASDVAAFIRHLCNGSLVALDKGKQCLRAVNAISNMDSVVDLEDPIMIQAMEFASSSAEHYVPNNEELETAISLLTTAVENR